MTSYSLPGRNGAQHGPQKTLLRPKCQSPMPTAPATPTLRLPASDGELHCISEGWSPVSPYETPRFELAHRWNWEEPCQSCHKVSVEPPDHHSGLKITVTSRSKNSQDKPHAEASREDEPQNDSSQTEEHELGQELEEPHTPPHDHKPPKEVNIVVRLRSQPAAHWSTSAALPCLSSARAWVKRPLRGLWQRAW